jgi:hypothetical protein
MGMSLPNDVIDSHVRAIAAALLKDTKVRPVDEPIIRAGVELISNLLQNINDIAYCAISAYRRDPR